MLRNRMPLGLAVAALALLAGVGARGQVLGPPGAPPSEQRGLAKGEPTAVPDTGCPMCCQPEVETRTVNKRVYTDLAVLEVTDKGFVVRDTVPGISLTELQALGDAELYQV